MVNYTKYNAQYRIMHYRNTIPPFPLCLIRGVCAAELNGPHFQNYFRVVFQGSLELNVTVDLRFISSSLPWMSPWAGWCKLASCSLHSQRVQGFGKV